MLANIWAMASNVDNNVTGEAGDTRTRILQCSRQLFSENTYADVSLKDIAAAAQVSVALIVKHFQSKQRLFERTVDFSKSSSSLFAGPFEQLGRTAVVETLTAPHTAHYSMARTISVASGDAETLSAIGQRIRTDLLEVLAGRIRDEAPHPNPSPELRAQTAVSLILGLSMMRRFGDAQFNQWEQSELEEHYAELFQQIIDGRP